MELTRRTFLAVAGGAAAAPLGRHASSPTPAPVLLLDGAAPGLSESARGCAAALAVQGAAVRRVSALSGAAGRRPVQGIVIPAVLRLSNADTDALLAAAWGGAHVLVESAAAFGDAEAERGGRRWLRRAFGIEAAEGVALHAGADGRQRVPYVDFRGPLAAKVRDFSRVLPLAGAGWEPIAFAGGRAVGCARRTGRGVVAVLGSPLGPALAYGDREASAWLTAFLPGR